MMEDSMSKMSRRDFARTSLAAGAAAMAVPGGLLGNSASASTVAASSTAASTTAASAGASVARRVKASMPPDVAYGGLSVDGRTVMLADTLTQAGQAVPSYPNGWKEGTTIPAEYYLDPKHYTHDEQYMKDHFWWMIDHHSRIPKPGDFFTYQFGRGDSVIVVRDQDMTVKAFHNVCRHRGSRLIINNELLPTGAQENGKAPDPEFSISQLGGSGNSPVFRCPYHAWTYGNDGRLLSLPTGWPDGFDKSEYGLHPVTLKVLGGFIFITFADDPPDFETWVGPFKQAVEDYKTADLKIGARRSAPNKANWKLVIENFRECYHCGPAHSKSYATAYWSANGTLTDGQRAGLAREIERQDPRWHASQGTRQEYGNQRGQDQLIQQRPAGMGTAANNPRNPPHFRAGYVTASLDGKPVAPFLPGIKAYTNGMGINGRVSGTRLGFSTTAVSMYEDYVFCCHFTPRNEMHTDAELFFLVNPDAKEGKDFNADHLAGLWYKTLLEDRWVAENNHHGIMSSHYAYKGGQPYMAVEGGPAGFVKWYMRDVVSGERNA
jgi:phenylpropionate dioxygenase-like ring-hydroxylating dioxygenase large terminal subunit